MPRKNISFQEFEKKFNLKFKGSYICHPDIFKGMSYPSIFECDVHGRHIRKPYKVMETNGCHRCNGGRYTKEQVIIEMNTIHKNKYDYSNMVFIGVSRKIEIICPEHGSFYQQVAAHLRGSGCPMCCHDRKRLSTSHAVASFKKIHGDRYDYSKFVYINSITKSIITCRQHGDFKISYNKHIQGGGCPRCSKNVSKTLSEKIKNMTVVHGTTYDYSMFNADGSKQKSSIICRIHGVFMQSYVKHVSGQGCPKCFGGGWSRSDYIDGCKTHNYTSNLYFIKIYNEDELFYKIGITKRPTKLRFGSRIGCYNYEILSEINGNAGFIWDLEKKLHSILFEYKYRPNNEFNGFTECFSKIPRSVRNLIESMSSDKQIQLIA